LSLPPSSPGAFEGVGVGVGTGFGAGPAAALVDSVFVAPLRFRFSVSQSF